MNLARAHRRGIALMLAAMGCYALNDALVKLCARDLPPGQVLAVRGAFASLLVLPLAWRARGNWRDALEPIVLARCGLEVGTAFTSALALSLASLATVSTLMMTAPLMIALAAMALRWEPWQGRRLLVVGIGFAGVLLVIRPTARPDASAVGHLCALLCAASLAARDLVTRRIPPEIPSATIAVATTFAVCLFGLLLSGLGHWGVLRQQDIVALAGAAACAALGNFALIAACRGVDLSVVMPFRYSLIVWAMLLSYLIWHDTPRPGAIIGVLLIAAAGVSAIWTTRRA